MTTSAERGVPSALQLVEEAFHVLRRAPAADLLVFYAGTVPFVLDLLYYTADRTRTGSPGVVAALGAGFTPLHRYVRHDVLHAVQRRHGVQRAGSNSDQHGGCGPP